MVDHIALSYHILTRGGVIAHNQRGGLLVFIVDNQFNYFIVVGWFDVLADDTSESFFIFFMFSVILIFIEQFQVLLVVFGCCIYMSMCIPSIDNTSGSSLDVLIRESIVN